nr:hypothetical protein [Tanacetum cinerariifolium]
MGELTFFLGLNGIFINQDKYIAKILRKFGLTDGKSASTPIDTEKPLLKDPDGTSKASHLHAVKRIFKYLKGKPHLGLWYPKDSPFNLVAYSDSDYAGASLDRKSTTGGCQFLDGKSVSTPIDTKKPLLKDLDGKDVDVHTYRSMIGSLMYLTSSRPDIILISWQCKKQTVVATSSTEAEYAAAVRLCAQVLWIQNQLLDYG